MGHRSGISRRLWGAASGALLVGASCRSDSGGPTLTPRTALLALARKDTVNPSSPRTFQVTNNRLMQFSITHADPAGTLFAQFTFTPFTILSVCDTCTAPITVAATPRLYGFTIGGSSNLRFDAANRPTVTVSYTRYVDRAVYDSSGRYPTFAAFELALRLWRQRSPDDWIKESDAGPTTSATISGPLDAPGTYLVAAPR